MGICESSNNKAAAAQVQSATTALTNQANNTKPSEGISGLLGNALVPNQTQQKQVVLPDVPFQSVTYKDIDHKFSVLCKQINNPS